MLNPTEPTICVTWFASLRLRYYAHGRSLRDESKERPQEAQLSMSPVLRIGGHEDVALRAKESRYAQQGEFCHSSREEPKTDDASDW